MRLRSLRELRAAWRCAHGSKWAHEAIDIQAEAIGPWNDRDQLQRYHAG
jgi:hypothetical protein